MSWSKQNKASASANESYVHFTKEVSLYPEGELAPLALGLTGEAGEVADKIKKYFRDGVLDEEAVAYELGDVLWYLTRLADELGYSISSIRNMNRAKLEYRFLNNTIQGNGDKR